LPPRPLLVVRPLWLPTIPAELLPPLPPSGWTWVSIHAMRASAAARAAFGSVM
jgi:hypothetical protein